MNILLTNDDGIDAQGLNCLYNALKPNHNVYVIAPKENKSGTSQSINIALDFMIMGNFICIF